MLIVTTKEQSLHLKELGFDTKDASLYYDWPSMELKIKTEEWHMMGISAWTVEDLCNLLSKNDYTIGLFKEEYFASVCGYDEEKQRAYEHKEKGDSQLEAVYKLVCWTKEHNYI